jgi:hypothetical protein
MISTHPGSTPMASFKIVSLDGLEELNSYLGAGNDSGPYGENDDEQIFVQKVVPETDELYIRLASTGKRYVNMSYYKNIYLIYMYLINVIFIYFSIRIE